MIKKAVHLSLIIYFTVALTIIFIGKVVSPDKPVLTVKTDQQTATKTMPETNNKPAEDASKTTAPAPPTPTTTSQPTTKTTTSKSSTTSSSTKTTTSTTTSSGTSSGSSSSSGGSGGSTTPAAPACGSAGGACTSAEVATHNSQSNCWVTYNGSYYDVTSYVNPHPGGSSVFNSTTCGHDIGPYLAGARVAGQSHNHKQSAYTKLASYKIGPLK